ncbi:MAG: hypothetical protein KJO55_00865, partial [Gammaproteobacteria bacterium]|nr:hypothetical protein [Gammaproteobacteria bacterium]
MTEFLVVRLPGEDTQPVNWIVVDDVGEPLALPESGSLDDAATRAAQRKVVMLVPPQQVLRTNAVLPVKGQARMLQAIPFALEEHLATDVADMHFAIGERDSDGKVAVAAADKGS